MRHSPAILLCFAEALARADEPAGDLKAFQGTWVIREATLAARDHADDFKAMKLVVTGEKYTVTLGPVADSGTLTLDPAKTPKRIDLTTRKDGPFKGRNLPGIYELKDGALVLCLNSEKPDRPEAFDAPEKTPLMLLTFRREKKK
jgi:uncharacterized protein (TIGR03067 family)